MLNERFFQEKFGKFCGDFNKDYGEWTTGLLYKNLNYLESDQLVNLLENCLLKRETNFLPVPSRVLKMAEDMFPYGQSGLYKLELKEQLEKENKNPSPDCPYCENRGTISAKNRTDGFEQTFKCFCPRGNLIPHKIDTWGSRFLKEYIPRYDSLRKAPKVNSIEELLPANHQTQPDPMKSKLLTEQLFQQIGRQAN